MSMVSKEISTTTASLRQQLMAYPFRGKNEKNVLKPGSYVIEEEGSTDYRLIFRNKEGNQVSIPFSIDPLQKQWTCKNGQAFISDRLENIIDYIFQHCINEASQ